jgi:hypothetical protein
MVLVDEVLHCSEHLRLPNRHAQVGRLDEARRLPFVHGASLEARVTVERLRLLAEHNGGGRHL